MLKMYDGITPESLPKDGDIYAAYVDHPTNLYPDGNSFAALPRLFPGKRYVSITNWGVVSADVIDVEHDGNSGSASYAAAVVWARKRRAAGLVPTVYSDESTWPHIVASFQAAKEPLPLWWAADYDGKPVVPAGAIAKQYATAPGYDTSVVASNSWPTSATDEDMTPAQAQQLTQLDANVTLILHALGLMEYGDSEAAALAYGKTNKPPQGHPFNLYQIWQTLSAIKAKVGAE